MSELFRYLSANRKSESTSRLFLLNIATAVGIWGGYPRVPKVVERILEYTFMKYVMAAVLIYQGGGEQNLQLAIELSIFFFILNNALYLLDDAFEEDAPPIEEIVSRTTDSFSITPDDMPSVPDLPRRGDWM